MHDDNLMDQLLRETLSGAAPALSPGFDARLMRRVRPRRLTSTGRWVIAAYALLAVATGAWCMRDLPIVAIVAALGLTVPIAIGVGAYGRHVAAGN